MGNDHPQTLSERELKFLEVLDEVIMSAYEDTTGDHKLTLVQIQGCLSMAQHRVSRAYFDSVERTEVQAQLEAWGVNPS